MPTACHTTAKTIYYSEESAGTKRPHVSMALLFKNTNAGRKVHSIQPNVTLLQLFIYDNGGNFNEFALLIQDSNMLC